MKSFNTMSSSSFKMPDTFSFRKFIFSLVSRPSVPRKIKKENGFSYDLDEILSRLVYGRILYPSSNLSCYEQSKKLLEQPHFELHQIYRALSVLADNMDFVQAELYKRSKKVIKRNTGILFYDCTNYFFELEQASGLKQYGISKEHRPNPIVQMGLFMDKSGIPLAFCINDGNQNEQLSLQPLEQQIMRDFEHSKFVKSAQMPVCPLMQTSDLTTTVNAVLLQHSQ